MGHSARWGPQVRSCVPHIHPRWWKWSTLFYSGRNKLWERSHRLCRHTHIHQTATGSQTLRRGFPKTETSLTEENPPNKSSAPQIFGSLLYAGHHPPLHDLEINQRTNKEARPRNTCNLGGVVSWGQGRKMAWCIHSTSNKLKQKNKCCKPSWRGCLYVGMYVSADRATLPTQRALAPNSSAQAPWNHFNSLHLTSEASVPSCKLPWINVSSATFGWITDPSPSFFWSRLTEYFLHLYSIIPFYYFPHRLFSTLRH